ncbi:putative sensor-like histidine kinase [compost metagenome]
MQPIVENAFFHGLDSKSGEWRLQINVIQQDADVCIIVSDNGVGMDHVTLEELRKQLRYLDGELWTSGNRIGLQNVASRIQMHFGTEYVVTVQSQLNEGTQVTVKIPFVSKGEVR